jgi:hypothetical protein
VDYAYVYNTGLQTVVAEGFVSFATNGLITSAFSFVPSSSAIVFNVSGIYEATFFVTSNVANQLTFFLNGLPLADSVYGTDIASVVNPGQVVFTALAGSTLTLANHSSTGGSIILPPVSGIGPETIVNASILINRLA